MAVKQKIKQNTRIGYTIEELFEDFHRMKTALNTAPSTLNSYKHTMKLFLEFLGDRNTSQDITESTIYAFIVDMQERQISPATINHYMREVRAFLYWCMEEGYLEPFKIKMVREGELIKETYTDEELDLLLEKPRKQDSFVEWRTWCAINWILATGNRAETLCTVKIGDLDFNRYEIALKHTKNKKQQIIPMGREIAVVVKEYIRLWRFDAAADEYLFANVGNEKLTVNGLRIAVKKYNNKRGVKRSSVHAFRHTFAKKWILNTGDVFRLQKLLGHSTLEMTRRYVNLFSDELKQDFEQYNPLDRIRKSNSRTQTIKRNNEA